MIAQRKSRPVVLKYECDLSVGYVFEVVFKRMSFDELLKLFQGKARKICCLTYLRLDCVWNAGR